MRERRLLPCAGEHNFLLHIFTSLKRKRRFLKEAKHFYREDAKTAKRQKGRSKKHFSHGITRKYTESKHFFQSRMRKRRILKEAKYFYREDAKTAKRQKGRSKKHFSHGISRNFTETKHIIQSRMR